jgi:drug/metabolite transporter (DMT)-like permease
MPDKELSDLSFLKLCVFFALTVLKYSDSVLKGYATACSVVMTGVLSMILFGTELNIIYFLGIINVVIAVLLYNGKKDELDKYMC